MRSCSSASFLAIERMVEAVGNAPPRYLLRDRDAMPDLTKLHFAGLFAAQTRNAEGLGQILSEFFSVPVKVESLVGAWLTLPDSDYTRLGDSRENAEALDADCVLKLA